MKPIASLEILWHRTSVLYVHSTLPPTIAGYLRKELKIDGSEEVGTLLSRVPVSPPGLHEGHTESPDPGSHASYHAASTFVYSSSA